MKDLELRMYFFVPYQLTGIQKGIQCGHAALEYARRYWNDEQFIDFIDNWKTWVILDGGTTNSSYDDQGNRMGSLNNILDSLTKMGIKRSYFTEPDLENAITAVCFIADERVFNARCYPGPVLDESGEPEDMDDYNEFVESIGGLQNLFLRNLIKNKKLANG